MPDNSSAPYAAPENVMRILEKVHKNGLRGKIDAEFVGQLGIGEGMVNRTLRALEFLGFTDPSDEGAATPLLDQYIVSSEADARALLQEAIRKSYEVIFRAANPATDDRTKIHTAFKPMRPQGQWTRMVTFFLGICKAAGMEVKEPPLNRPGKNETPKERKDRKARQPRVTVPKGAPTPLLATLPGPSRTLDPALVGIISKIADIETAHDLEAWVDAFRATFSFVKKITLVKRGPE